VSFLCWHEQEFSRAVQRGQQASYLDQSDRNSPDVFRCALGNLGAGEQCRVRLELAVTLASDSIEGHARFELPLRLADQYVLAQRPDPSLQAPDAAQAALLADRALGALGLVQVQAQPLPDAAARQAAQPGDSGNANQRLLASPFFQLVARVACSSPLDPARPVDVLPAGLEVARVQSDLRFQADPAEGARRCLVTLQSASCPRDAVVLVVRQQNPYTVWCAQPIMMLILVHLLPCTHCHFSCRVCFCLSLDALP
jgi:hypothetical protein